MHTQLRGPCTHRSHISSGSSRQHPSLPQPACSCSALGRLRHRVQQQAGPAAATSRHRPSSSRYIAAGAQQLVAAGSSSSSTSSCRQRPGWRRSRFAAAAGGAEGAPSSGGGGASEAAPATVVVEAFSEDDLRGLTQEEQQLQEEALAEAWRDNFEGDLDGLYDYVDRDQMTLQEKVAEMKSVPRHLWNKVGLLDELSRFPPGLVADIMGMGTWRLKGMVDEVFEFLVTRIESSFRELLNTDLALYPVDKWKSKGWDFIDSMDPSREWEGFSYMDMPDPPKGAEGYPRLLVENRAYSSRVFRKLHLEVAKRQDGLQVLHMVLYPRYDFDIPILAMDLVAAGGALTLAIIDACPVTPRLTLPSHYAQTVAELQQNFLPESVLTGAGRNIPAWGAAIFSQQCVCITPQAPEELAGFMKYAVALTRAHLMYSQLLDPLRPMDKPSARRLQELLACHARFCEQQLANKKTARVLEAAFDAEFSDAYMREFMFDYSPREDVPWFDGSVAQMYQYFEDNPEVWRDAGLFLKTKLELDGDKASEYLRRFLSGDASIKLPRLAFAMQHMYDTDEDFQVAVDRYMLDQPPDSVPDTADMGEWLAKDFMRQMDEQQQQWQEVEQQLQAGDAAATEAQQAAQGQQEQQQQQQQQQGGSNGGASGGGGGAEPPPEQPGGKQPGSSST